MTAATGEGEDSRLPDDSDLAFYREHGWWVSPPIVSDEELARVWRGVERHYAGERDWRLPAPIKPYLDWNPDSEVSLRLNDYIVLQNHDVGVLLDNPLIGACAARLAGTPRIRLFNSSLIYKPPGVDDAEVTVGWHTDRAYWMTCTSESMLTAWIPLHDCTVESGTLTMLDGSHRWPAEGAIAELRRERNFITGDPEELDRRLAAADVTVRGVPMELRRGQVSFHHCKLFHGSPPNRSDAPRVAVVLHLQDDANRYRRHIDETGSLYRYNNDLFCRPNAAGEPDYTDPVICRELWAEPDPGAT